MGKVILQGEKEIERGIHYEFDRLEPPIGEGGMGIVYKGLLVNEISGQTREIAIKEIKETEEKAMREIVERAKREASIQLHNDNVVEMMGFLETEESMLGFKKKRYYVVSEFLHGVTLDEVIFKGKFVNDMGEEIGYARELYERYTQRKDETSCFIMKKVLYGIMALHDEGYIHRDIDPSNLMVTLDGKIKLIDFGIAKKKDNVGPGDKRLTTAGQFVGKAEYAAPELVTGDTIHQDYTTDIYALGVLFFQLLTGHLPFEGPHHEVLNAHLHNNPPLQKISNSRYRKVIGKAMEKVQSKRFASVAEFRVELDKKANPVNTKIIVGAFSAVAVVCLAFVLIKILPKSNPEPIDPDSSIVIPSRIIISDNDIFLIDTFSKEKKEKRADVDEHFESIKTALDTNPENAVALFCLANYCYRFNIADKSNKNYSYINDYYDKFINDGFAGKHVTECKFTRFICSYLFLCKACEAIDKYPDESFGDDKSVKFKADVLQMKEEVEKELGNNVISKDN